MLINPLQERQQAVAISQERLQELNQNAVDTLYHLTEEEQMIYACRLLSGALIGYLYDNGLSEARSELYKIHHHIEAKLLKEAIHKEGH